MSHFFAYLAKMKLIQRWGLMRNTSYENIQEHSLQVAMIAHALALIKNKYFGGKINPDQVMVIASYHEVGEVITGDIATPIKYFNPEIKKAYDEIELIARQRIFNMLPEDFREEYRSILFNDNLEYKKIIKAADKIAAYIKCLEEKKTGNTEFEKAEKAIKAEIENLSLPEVSYFMKTFIPSFSLTLDELN